MAIQYISDDAALEDCITHLKQCSEFGIDLEFDKNRYRYGFNLCLMQIFSGTHCFLIDPLSNNLNIRKIFSVLEDASIRKVVFAFGEDLRLLHSLGCFPKNIYDLDIVTSLLNYPPASLANLLTEILGVELGKSSQQSNWFKRPLSDQQKEYAADDVRYLLELKDELSKRTENTHISEWIAQENALIDELDFSDDDHNTVIKHKDKKDLSVYEWHIFTSLMNFIDQTARKYNKPAYQIIDKKYLTDIARNPHLLDEWHDVGGIYRKLKTAKFKKEIERVLEGSIQEAEQQDLSKTEKADKPLSREEYQALREEQRRVNTIKAEIFVPIQHRISEDYGAHVKTFLLSNRGIKDVIYGHCTLPEYKKELFHKYAKELNLDVSPYLNLEKKAS